ncbi:hypothetical protein Q9L58_007061 [Maublancomyces gigas]|uniref:Uncharacterized protein n=1 Tax=Discina gigas TaxID=1032678 RepID=A0ABR3GE04_9PEZI
MQPMWARTPQRALPPTPRRIPNTPTARAQAASLDELAALIAANKAARRAGNVPRSATLPIMRPSPRPAIPAVFNHEIPVYRPMNQRGDQDRYFTLPTARPTSRRPGIPTTFFGMEIHIDPPSAPRISTARLPGQGRPRASTYPQLADREAVHDADLKTSQKPSRSPFNMLNQEQVKGRTGRKRSLSLSALSWMVRRRQEGGDPIVPIADTGAVRSAVNQGV